MIELENGRLYLLQWEQEQRVQIDNFPPGTYADFSHQNDCVNSALTMEAYAEDGHVYADIPNILLQQPGYLHVVVYPAAGDRAHKPEERDIKIVRREKPSNYIYSETEVLTYKGLEKQIEEANEQIESLDIINLYVCSDGEYAADGTPVIATPDEGTAYLVPQDNEGILYASWVYVNGAWEFVEMLTVTFEETDIDKAELIKDVIRALPVYNGEVVAV